MDPGNFATNIQAGARYGYGLLWVVLLANLIAMLFQALSAKLGIVTGRNLAEDVERNRRWHSPGARSPNRCRNANCGDLEVQATAPCRRYKTQSRAHPNAAKPSRRQAAALRGLSFAEHRRREALPSLLRKGYAS